MNKEEIKEFWEWCGFTYIDKKLNERWIFTPEGTNQKIEVYGDRYITPNKSSVVGWLPMIDLNNLFKYAVPKLINDGWEIFISYDQFFNTWYAELNHPNKQAILEESKEVEGALFYAIQEVIKCQK